MTVRITTGAPGVAGVTFRSDYELGDSVDQRSLVRVGSKLWLAMKATNAEPDENSDDWAEFIDYGPATEAQEGAAASAAAAGGFAGDAEIARAAAAGFAGAAEGFAGSAETARAAAAASAEQSEESAGQSGTFASASQSAKAGSEAARDLAQQIAATQTARFDTLALANASTTALVAYVDNDGANNGAYSRANTSASFTRFSTATIPALSDRAAKLESGEPRNVASAAAAASLGRVGPKIGRFLSADLGADGRIKDGQTNKGRQIAIGGAYIPEAGLIDTVLSGPRLGPKVGRYASIDLGSDGRVRAGETKSGRAITFAGSLANEALVLDIVAKGARPGPKVGRLASADIGSDGRVVSGNRSGIPPVATARGGILEPVGLVATEQSWGYVSAPTFRAWDASTIALVVVLGQSLATGLSDIGDGNPAQTDPLAPDYFQPISTTPLHPGFALMFDGGAGVGPWVNGRSVTGLKDLREVTDDIAGRLESVASGMADVILTEMNARLGYKRQLLVAAVGQSGFTLPQIARGSAVWNEFIRLLQAARRLAGATGKRVTLGGVVYIQGEAEHPLGVDRYWYANELRRLLDDAQAEARYQLDQVEPVRMLCSVPSRGYRSTTLISPVSEGIRLAARNDARIAISAPNYAAPHATIGSHPTPRGYRRMAYPIGDAAVGHFFGDGWTPLEPDEWWWTSSTALRIKYRMPGRRYDLSGGDVVKGAKSALVIDTSGALVTVPAGNGRGYRATDASGEITVSSVALVAGTTDQLDVTLAVPPSANFRLVYAARGDAGNADDGGGAETGPRGVIRCDFGRTIPNDPVPCWHWAIPHEIRA